MKLTRGKYTDCCFKEPSNKHCMSLNSKNCPYLLFIPSQSSRNVATSTPACLVYNRNNGEILKWGRSAAMRRYGEKYREDEIYLGNFQSKLHQICLNSKKEDRSSEDRLIFKLLGKFLKLVVNEAIENALKTIEQQTTETNKEREDFKSNAHFIFVVPTEWKYDIRDKIIRPLFIAAGLIGETDHPNRLLFFTVVDCFFYEFQSRLFRYCSFSNGRQFDINKDLKIGVSYIKCTISPLKNEEELLILCDAFELQNPPAVNRTDFSPNLLNSAPLKVDLDAKVKSALLNFLTKNYTFEESDFFGEKERVLEEIIRVMKFYFFENQNTV
jgi:hypothetical protein